MQALEWAILGSEADFVRSAVVIGCGAAHTAWQIGISETQRQAIYADPKWNNGRVDYRSNAFPYHPLSSHLISSPQCTVLHGTL
jgi:homoserine O-acetyltransferase